MRKLWLKTTIGVLGGALAAFLLGAIFLHEPSCNGKTVGAWLTEFDKNTAEARAAIQQIGPRALPRVISELRAHDPAWVKKLVELAKKQSFVKFSHTPDTLRRERSIQACKALGPLSKPAIPALGEALGRGSGSAGPVLVSFGSDAVPTLAKALTNAPGCSTPYYTAHALGRMGAGAKLAVTNLAWEFEHHSIVAPRIASAKALGLICQQLIERDPRPDCAEVVHAKAALIRGLSGPNAAIQIAAADALAVFGPNAREATAALTGLLDHPLPLVRQSVVRALEAIDPIAASVAGAKG